MAAGRECSSLQGFRNGAVESPDQQYARICADTQRVGNFGAEVPEIRDGGLIPPVPRAAAHRRDGNNVPKSAFPIHI
ncbi:MAG TPA: hypothetical protein VLK56_01015 [Solirubrobacterales bacterium]|nr:hypothetical protein [Solirubrobacterales bacterium]